MIKLSKSFLYEVFWVVASVIIALICLYFFSDAFVASGYYYQQTFGPSVMDACGHGLLNNQILSPKFLAFLQREASSMSCADIGMVGPVTALSMIQKNFVLLKLASVFFGVFGIEWASLTKLSLCFAVLVAVFTFGISRQFVKPYIALLVVALVFIYPDHLNEIKNLRDYAKAPAILLIVFILVLISKLRDVPKYLVYQGGLGIALAVGSLMRPDALIMFPVCLLWGALYNDNLKARPWVHVVGVCILVVAYWATSNSISNMFWVIDDEASALGHVAYLGLANQFWHELEVSVSLEALANYSDIQLSQILSTFYRQNSMGSGDLIYLSDDYDKVSLLAYLNYIFYAPYDYLSLGREVMINIFEVPHLLFGGLYGHNFILPSILAILSVLDKKKAVFYGLILISLAYLGFAQVLQFHVRHYFVYKILVLITVGLSLISISVLVCKILSPRFENRFFFRNFLSGYSNRAVFIWGLNASIMFSGSWLGIFSVWQETQFAALISNYRSFELEIPDNTEHEIYEPVRQHIWLQKGYFQPVKPLRGYVFKLNNSRCINQLITLEAEGALQAKSYGIIPKTKGDLYFWASNSNDVHVEPIECASDIRVIGIREPTPIISNFFIASGTSSEKFKDDLVPLLPVRSFGSQEANDECGWGRRANLIVEGKQTNVDVNNGAGISIDGPTEFPKGYLLSISAPEKTLVRVEGHLKRGKIALSTLDSQKNIWLQDSSLDVGGHAAYFVYSKEIDIGQTIIVSSNLDAGHDSIAATIRVTSCRR